MLNRPDQRTIKALHSLKTSQDWRTVWSWLEDSLKELRSRTDTEESEIQLRWNQGGCQALRELLQAPEDAMTALKKQS